MKADFNQIQWMQDCSGATTSQEPSNELISLWAAGHGLGTRTGGTSKRPKGMNLTKEQVQMALSELDKALAQVDTILAPVLAKPLSDTVKGMAPLDSAKLQVTLAYTMNTLFYRKKYKTIV